jgi:hypothetical protein
MCIPVANEYVLGVFGAKGWWFWAVLCGFWVFLGCFGFFWASFNIILTNFNK